MTDNIIRVYWWDHDCEWVSKYCDENCRRSALIPVGVLRKYAAGAN